MSAGFELMAPLWLLLWPALLVIALLWRLAGSGKPASLATGTRAASHFFHPLATLLAASGQREETLPRWKQLMLWGAFSGMVVSLAQPVHIGARLPEPPHQRDIVFIVDTSVSMLLRDYTINEQRVRRIDMLKRMLDRLVQQLPDDRIGMVVFGDSAHTLVPLTTDHQLLRSQLARLDTDIAGRYGAVGDAVAMAVRAAGKKTSRERRILMLFTDAQSQAGRIAPLAAAELARESRLQLYTVAIGATSYAAAEKQASGLVYHPADIELMQQLAKRTGADSYHADSTEALEQAVRDITARKAKSQQGDPVYERMPLYHWPLLAAIVMLLLCQLGPLRGMRR
jgi:Ca-activated chloride channel family protein